MTVKVYAKSDADLLSKVGVYAYILDNFKEQLSNCKPFLKPIKTLTQADCMAYVNALHILSNTDAVTEVKTLEIITDSSKVAKLIEVFGFEKHCEEIAHHWRVNVKPKFVKLEHIKIVKLDRKLIAGDSRMENLLHCQIRAHGELQQQKDLIR